MSACAYGGCSRRVDYVIEGVRWCGMHGRRIRKTGSPDMVRKVASYAGRQCSVAECTEQPRRNGMCPKHSRQARYRGQHPLFTAWREMLYRCENPKCPAYSNYGGRGISACERWHDFAAFAEDITRLLGPRPDGLTLDRIGNDGNYEPGNVRWATRAQQNQNRQYRRESYPNLRRERRGGTS